jgi:hypothetical protein
MAEVVRVATKLAREGEKEAMDKVVEEERQRKNTENREDETHPMDLDIPGMSTCRYKSRDNEQWFRPWALGAFSTSRSIGSKKLHI